MHSVFTQSIDFYKNVQLVIVDPCALFEKNTFCGNLEKSASNNVVYVKEDIAGQSDIWLSYIQNSVYTTFMSGQDAFTANTMNSVVQYFHTYGNVFDILAVPVYYMGTRKRHYGRYLYNGKKNRIVNLDIEPYHVLTATQGIFYKTSVLLEAWKKNNELTVNLFIYTRKKALGYVCEKNVQYLKRMQPDNKGLNCLAAYSTAERLQVLQDEKNQRKDKEIPPYIIEYMLYELKEIISTASETEYTCTVAQVEQLLAGIDKSFILNTSKVL